MGHVTINIRGRAYQVACDHGQEAHLARLGRYLDERASQLVESTGSINEQLLLVMIGLVVADELTDAAAEIESLSGANSAGQSLAEADAALAEAIGNLASRVEKVAARLEDT